MVFHGKNDIWYNKNMTEIQTGTTVVKWSIVGMTGNEQPICIQIPMDISPKGVKTFTIDLDDFEISESGTKTKNGKVVHFITYKINK